LGKNGGGMKRLLTTIGIFCSLSIFAVENISIQEKEIIVIIPSYNNEKWCEKNLDSVFLQKYKNFKVIYINDNSTDATQNLIESYRVNNHLEDKLAIINNFERCGALYNVYHAVHSCTDTAIIIIVDGDDWLKHDQVFVRVNDAYSNPNVWLTYGSYDCDPPQKKGGCCAVIPHDVIKKNNFRGYKWVSTALRTFYAGIFKKIKKEDLFYEGKFFEMAGDLAYMFPMLEMCGDRFKFIPEILYTYNVSNPINDSRKNGRLQGKMDTFIRKKERYQRI
jgi:glycosyltransferase involved in cell wall biosynthesis